VGVGTSPGVAPGAATTGGTTTGTTTGGTTTGTSGSGTGSVGASLGCDTLVVATGAPAVIDDFDHGSSWGFSDNSDGRTGTWEHEYAVDAASGRQVSSPECGVSCGSAGEGELSPGHLVAKCSGEAWCAGGAYDEDAWGNWAAVSVPLAGWSEDEIHCYDARVFTGIEFLAWSSLETKIRVQVLDPESAPEEGISYQSPVITLPAAKPESPTQIPFTAFRIPDWVADQGGNVLNPAGLRGISFAVRSVSPVSDGAGERLVSYEVNLDDVAFY